MTASGSYCGKAGKVPYRVKRSCVLIPERGIHLYRKRKKEAAQILIDRLDKFIPGTKSSIEYYEVGTPGTIKSYTLNPNGTAYGYAQIPNQTGRKRVKIKSPVPGLYFASAWTEPGHGFTGAIVSGSWCAEEIIRSGKLE